MGNGLLVDLDGYYKLQEEAPNKDASVNGRTLQILNGTSFPTVAGKVGLGAEQSSTNTHRRGIPGPSPFHYASSFSLNFWIRGSTADWNEGNSDSLIAVWDDVSGNQRAWMLYWDATSNQFVFIVSVDGTATTTLQMGTVVPPDGEYFQLSFGFDDDNNEIWGQYRNGPRITEPHAGAIFAASTAPFSAFWAASFGLPFRMGAYDYDELGIWGRSLSEDEVAVLETTFFDQFTGDPMAFSAIRSALALRNRAGEAEPADLELEAVDLQDAADFESRLLDLRDNFVFTIWINLVQNAATVGSISIFADLYARDGVTLIESVLLVSGLVPTSDNQAKLQFGEGITERLVGTGVIGPELASLKILNLVKLRVVKSTPADTAATLSVRMQLGD